MPALSGTPPTAAIIGAIQSGCEGPISDIRVSSVGMALKPRGGGKGTNITMPERTKV